MRKIKPLSQAQIKHLQAKYGKARDLSFNRATLDLINSILFWIK